MISVERTFTVESPQETVVEYLKDFAHATQWDPGTQSCVREGSGPLEVGSTWKNISIFRGRTTQLEYRLTVLEPAHLRFVGTNKTATSTDDMTFTPTATGTTIRYHAQIAFNGLAKLAGPFLQGEFNRLADETVLQMTAAIAAL